MDNDNSILHHTLGLSDYRVKESYRNHFVASDGHHDIEVIDRLCKSGLMEERKAPGFCSDETRVFIVTEAGKKVAYETRPKPPNMTRGQKRYQKYLDSDCCQSFGDWLKDPYWDEYRATQ
jgi:hypothetical protein